MAAADWKKNFRACSQGGKEEVASDPKIEEGKWQQQRAKSTNSLSLFLEAFGLEVKEES